MVTTLLLGLVTCLLLVTTTSKSKSLPQRERFEIRAECSKKLSEKVSSRANRDGITEAEAIRRYVILGMHAEDSIAGTIETENELCNIEAKKPAKSRRQIQRYMIESDLIPQIEKTELAQVSKSEFVNHCIRKELLAQKNGSKQDAKRMPK